MSIPGASSSSVIDLNDIKHHVINSIKGLLNFNIEHSNNSEMIDNKQTQQDMSMPPTMV